MKSDLAQKKEDWEKKRESYRKQTTEVIPARNKKFRDEAWDQILKKNETDFQKAFEGLRGSKDKFVAELERRIAGIPGHVGSSCERSDLITRAKTLYLLQEANTKIDVHNKLIDERDTEETKLTDDVWAFVIHAADRENHSL